MSLRLIEKPSVTAVSLASAKIHLKVDDSSEDAWISAAIAAAVAVSEQKTGRVWITQTWEAVYDDFPLASMDLGKAPVQSIVSIKYIDVNGTEQTIDSAYYVLDKDQNGGYGYVLPLLGYDWPTTAGGVNSVRIRFTAGYGATEADVPENARLWMLMHVGTAYRMRESVAGGFNVTDLPSRYHDALLDPLKVYK